MMGEAQATSIHAADERYMRPGFVFLTRLSAWLYSQSHSKYETTVFLIERGFS